MLKPVLLILHQEHSSPGRVGQTLAKLGHLLDVRRPRFGDPLPETMDDHAGAVIFGGPQSANDNEEFVHREIDWIEVPLRDKKPYLGICLGAQMLARQLGARVFPHPDGHAEVGPIMSINGIAKASTFPWVASCWLKAMPSPCRHFVMAPATRCSFIPKSRTR
jgi:GMP synthase-like glutamine amidotransferase